MKKYLNDENREVKWGCLKFSEKMQYIAIYMILGLAVLALVLVFYYILYKLGIPVTM